MAVLVVPILAAALVAPDDPLGRVGRLALIVGSRDRGPAASGRVAACASKAGVFAMAVIDAVFIFGDFFDGQNAQFNAAVPGADLLRFRGRHR